MNIKKLTLCHPVFHRLIEMDQQGEDIAGWVRQLGGGSLHMDGIGMVSAHDILYYYKKFLLFKESGCFSDRDPGAKHCASLRTEDVDALLANLTHIVFEVTDQCNLECEYCAYGRFYDNFAPRKNRHIDPLMAIRALNDSLARIKTARNDSSMHPLFIGFYGGEPLLNFPLIQAIVDHLGRSELPGIIVKYSMTTNGMLLDKYMDFLVKHEFSLLISLDGNEKNNSYRVDKKGKPVFSRLFRNVKAMQAKYPEYFKKLVNFNVVLHDRNAISDIVDFFKREFDIFPMLSGISAMGIREEVRDEFTRIYNIASDNLKNCSASSVQDRQMLFRLPEIAELMGFLRHQNSFGYVNFNNLLGDEKATQMFPTGTCLPFQKKIYITVDGRIYPCERIGEFPILGRMGPDGLEVDHGHVARLFNGWLDKVRRQCASCYNADGCPICMYYIDDFPDVQACQWHGGYDGFSRTVCGYLDLLEKKPRLYSEIVCEI